MDDVPPGGSRVPLGIEKGQDAILLIRRQSAPQAESHHAHDDIAPPHGEGLQHPWAEPQEQNGEDKDPRTPQPRGERKDQADHWRGQHQQKPGVYTDPEQHHEQNPQEDDGGSEIGLKTDEHKRNEDYDAGGNDFEEGLWRLLPPAQVPGQHEDGGEFGNLGRLTDSDSANGEPGLGARCRAGPRSNKQGQNQHGHGPDVDKWGQPFQNSRRHAEQQRGARNADEQPHNLPLPDIRCNSREVGLTRRIDRRQPRENQSGHSE